MGVQLPFERLGQVAETVCLRRVDGGILNRDLDLCFEVARKRLGHHAVLVDPRVGLTLRM